MRPHADHPDERADAAHQVHEALELHHGVRDRDRARILGVEVVALGDAQPQLPGDVLALGGGGVAHRHHHHGHAVRAAEGALRRGDGQVDLLALFQKLNDAL
jgi:hypothetical protein